MMRLGSQLALVRILVLAAAVAPGVTLAQGSYDQSPFIDILPGLRAAPAPTWLQPGMRITFYSAAASIAAERKQLVEDPAGPVTMGGKRYREEDISGAGLAGAAYSVVQVVYVDRSVAILDLRSYTIYPHAGNGASLTAFRGGVFLPGAGGEVWIHPQALARAPGLQLGEELRALRMGYALNGRQHRVIRLQGKNGSWNFEEESGVLLRSTSTAETTVLIPPPSYPGNVRAGTGGTLVAQNTLVDGRTPVIPWAQAPPPPWLQNARRLRYDGTYATVVPGLTSFRNPVYSVYERQQYGGRWARYSHHVMMPNAPGLPPIEATHDRLFGPAQITGLWIPPDFLARLQPGQVLDRDAVTRVVTTVSGVAGNELAITEANEVHQADYGYDLRTGIMTRFQLADKVGKTVIEIRLVSVQ